MDWVGRKSVDITDLNTPSVVRTALDALKLKQTARPLPRTR
ncbi:MULTISPECIES: hypothetical protein [unclassified Streptomyces]|nr:MULTISPECIES: hypothetical protein [unclassified Streptomyces]MCX4408709.1 hypothetical protein [Streptomyces sp. NBC_01764]MCX5091373.1 hypothetical protein [Streptomyces sp. NBC_00365]MCX5185954.1 hypothetical protein [Streptomyces sp. NBC_00268]